MIVSLFWRKQSGNVKLSLKKKELFVSQEMLSMYILEHVKVSLKKDLFLYTIVVYQQKNFM